MARLRLRNKRRLGRPPTWLVPRFLERRYNEVLQREVVQRLREAVRSEVVPRLKLLKFEADQGRPRAPVSRADDLATEILALQDALTLALNGNERSEREQRDTVQDVGSAISDANRAQWSKIIRASIGVDLWQQEPFLANQQSLFVSQNVQLIQKLKQDSVSDIQGIVQRGLQQGLRVEEIQAQVQQRVNVTEGRAKLIARDQVAKANAELTQLRQENLGVSKYIWRTAKDERVRGKASGIYPDARPKHSNLEGKTCVWSDPTVWIDQDGKRRKRSSIQAVELHPGQDFQCRCTAEPVLSDLL